LVSSLTLSKSTWYVEDASASLSPQNQPPEWLLQDDILTLQRQNLRILLKDMQAARLPRAVRAYQGMLEYYDAHPDEAVQAISHFKDLQLQKDCRPLSLCTADEQLLSTSLRKMQRLKGGGKKGLKRKADDLEDPFSDGEGHAPEVAAVVAVEAPPEVAAMVAVEAPPEVAAVVAVEAAPEVAAEVLEKNTRIKQERLKAKRLAMAPQGTLFKFFKPDHPDAQKTADDCLKESKAKEIQKIKAGLEEEQAEAQAARLLDEAAELALVVEDRERRHALYGADGSKAGVLGGRPPLHPLVKEAQSSKSNRVQPGVRRKILQPPNAQDALAMIKWMKEKRDLLPAQFFWQQARIRYAPRTKASLQSILDKEEEDVRSYVRTYVRTYARTYVRTYVRTWP